jgi:hypothetical protein
MKVARTAATTSKAPPSIITERSVMSELTLTVATQSAMKIAAVRRSKRRPR